MKDNGREVTKATKDIWGLGHRREYSNLLRVAGQNITKGPYPLEKFWAREFEWIGNRKCGWSAPDANALRELALAFWIGSEFDVAVIRIDPGESGAGPKTRVFHSFDALTNIILHMTHNFAWDPQGGFHQMRKEYDRVNLVTDLLTCYNVVFVDDMTENKSWVFFHEFLPVTVPPKIRIQKENGRSDVFLKSTTKRFSLDPRLEKTVRRPRHLRQIAAQARKDLPNLKFAPFQVDLPSWRKCGGDIKRWLNREKLNRKRSLRFAILKEKADRRRMNQTAQECLNMLAAVHNGKRFLNHRSAMIRGIG